MNTTEEFSNLQKSSEDFRSVQNTSEDFRNIQRASERAGGIGRGKKYPGSETPEHEFDRDDYIIMEEAYAGFEEAGERRSVRMIAEYCKNGELVCFYDSDDKRWHITRESVENKITKIKALNARKTVTAAPTSASEKSSEGHATSQQDAGTRHERSEASHESFDDIKELEREILDLKIANRGKDYFIEQLQKERGEFITRIEDNSRLVGELKTKLLQLEAPRPERGIDRSTQGLERDAAYTSSDQNERPHTSNVHPHRPLSDSANTTHHYEQSTPHSFEEER
jgi:hypothetical protein